MEVNGQRQGPASWSMEEEYRYPLNVRLDGPRRRSGRFFEKMESLSPAGIRTPDRSARRQTECAIPPPLPKFKIIHKHRYLETVWDTRNSSRTFGTSLHTNFIYFFLKNCPLTIRFRSTQRLAWPTYSLLNYCVYGDGRGPSWVSSWVVRVFPIRTLEHTSQQHCKFLQLQTTRWKRN
jgi:hypothetical protein